MLTENGVCFVDFGSAVRAGENIQGNPLLANLYDELMRTSQIQRMIEKMTLSGAVTSHLIQSAYGRVDKQVDLFYLAMQMVQPLNNPDFQNQVAGAVSTFLQDPKSLSVTIAPDAPISAAEIVGIASTAPQSLPERLKASVTTNTAQ